MGNVLETQKRRAENAAQPATLAATSESAALAAVVAAAAGRCPLLAAGGAARAAAERHLATARHVSCAKSPDSWCGHRCYGH